MAFGSDKDVVLYRLGACCSEMSWSEVEAEFLDEMAALEIACQVVDGTALPESYPVSVLEPFMASPTHAAAVLFYRRPERRRVGVLIAMFDRADGEPQLTEHTFEMADSPGASAVVTLKAVEAVHAAFFESPLSVEDAPRTSGAPEGGPGERRAPSSSGPSGSQGATATIQAADAVTGATPPARGRLFGVGADLVALGGPGSAGPMLGLAVTAHVQPASWMVLEASSMFSLLSRLLVYEDTARLSLRLVILRGVLLWNVLPEARIRPQLGVAGGVAHGRSIREGRDSPARETYVWVGTVGGTGRLAIEIVPWMVLNLGVTVAAWIPEMRVTAEVRQAGETVRTSEIASAGRPMVEGTVGFRVRF